ncbi:MAG: NAD+ synthase [Candidatus Thermoplasmatota archaeon]|nr:NAD+ synthase [Candidatus Thermoplasmatota archaeon]MBS3802177.1 NAD+ synthase [Candidatus Thermoplasmatota archaeon]
MAFSSRSVRAMSLLSSFNEEEATTVIKLFMKTYVKNAHSDSIVLGLSGGVDSAVAAVLCQQVFGKKHTHCLFLPDEATPAKDRHDVSVLEKDFDLTVEEQDITGIVNDFLNQTQSSKDKLVKANVKARLRMVMLYAYANKTNSLVCGTSNKSEFLIGYLTKYGDGGVDFMPLGDLYKTQVWQIARTLQLPTCMIEKPPTAGLWKGQTDEKELNMTYETLDQILAGLERKMDVADIAKALNIDVKDVARIQDMRVCSQHKRNMPLIPKIGMRTPGLDWRSPVQLG